METRGPVYEVGAQFTEQLNYSNPFRRKVVTVWYNNERFFMLDTPFAVVWTDPPDVPVKEYIFLYRGSTGNPVSGQFPIMSLVPGSYHYQPISEIVTVAVPPSYQANSFRSESDILKSSYPTTPTGQYFVRPIL